MISELLGVCLRHILVWHHTLTHPKIYSQLKSYREKQNNHATTSHFFTIPHGAYGRELRLFCLQYIVPIRYSFRGWFRSQSDGEGIGLISKYVRVWGLYQRKEKPDIKCWPQWGLLQNSQLSKMDQIIND